MDDVKPMKILLIDDDAPVLEMLAQMISMGGHDVDTAASGETAVEKLKTAVYSLVITDIRMPGISGIDVAAFIKSSEGPQPPVIGISGTPWLLESGPFDACLSKPCGKKKLYEVIRQVCPDF